MFLSLTGEATHEVKLADNDGRDPGRIWHEGARNVLAPGDSLVLVCDGYMIADSIIVEVGDSRRTVRERLICWAGERRCSMGQTVLLLILGQANSWDIDTWVRVLKAFAGDSFVLLTLVVMGIAYLLGKQVVVPVVKSQHPASIEMTKAAGSLAEAGRCQADLSESNRECSKILLELVELQKSVPVKKGQRSMRPRRRAST